MRARRENSICRRCVSGVRHTPSSRFQKKKRKRNSLALPTVKAFCSRIREYQQWLRGTKSRPKVSIEEYSCRTAVCDRACGHTIRSPTRIEEIDRGGVDLLLCQCSQQMEEIGAFPPPRCRGYRKALVRTELGLDGGDPFSTKLVLNL